MEHEMIPPPKERREANYGDKRRVAQIACDCGGMQCKANQGMRPDGTVRLWDVKSAKVVASDWEHSAVRCLAFSGDGKALACGGADGRVDVWRVPAGE